MSVTELRPNLDHWQERVDLAAAFRWTARLNMHEAVANHFSLAINADGTRFLMNPNQMHFARIKASDLLEIDANACRASRSITCFSGQAGVVSMMVNSTSDSTIFIFLIMFNVTRSR